jgi:hypothetical protein
MNFSVFAADGTNEYALPDPDAHVYAFPVIDEAPDGKAITAGVGAVRWTFNRLTQEQYDAIRARIGARGEIRLRTRNAQRQWVTLAARLDPNPGSPTFYRGEVRGVTIEFRRAEAV